MQRVMEGVSNRLRRRTVLNVVQEPPPHRTEAIQQQQQQRRLEELFILEILEEGERDYRRFTVRELYSHVMKAITLIKRSTYSEASGLLPVIRERQRKAKLSDRALVIQDNHRTEKVLDPPPPPPPSSEIEKASPQIPPESVTYRERLGGHLHPRDMRRLITPFSGSNEPALIVRRHVMLLNFDPLRAIILRDRVLIIVPEGADSILESIEHRVRGGVAEIENAIFGKLPLHAAPTSHHVQDSTAKGSDRPPLETCPTTKTDTSFVEAEFKEINDGVAKTGMGQRNHDSDAIKELADHTWIDLPFELQCVDAVLHSVTDLLANQASDVQDEAVGVIDHLLEPGTGVGDFAQEILRRSRNRVNDMMAKVQGFLRALTLLLDEDEDMALMNLSRLITNPELFIQPVPAYVLEEESDEPELILASDNTTTRLRVRTIIDSNIVVLTNAQEAYRQQAVSLTNELALLKEQLQSIAELLHRKSDTVQNRLLYINMVISIMLFAATLVTVIVGIFGMNLPNRLEKDPRSFSQVTIGSVCGAFLLIISILLVLRKCGILVTSV